MAVATKISFDKKKNQIELESYASEPVRLNNLQVKVKNQRQPTTGYAIFWHPEKKIALTAEDFEYPHAGRPKKSVDANVCGIGRWDGADDGHQPARAR